MSQVAKHAAERAASSGNERAILRFVLYLTLALSLASVPVARDGSGGVMAAVALAGLACSAYKEGE